MPIRVHLTYALHCFSQHALITQQRDGTPEPTDQNVLMAWAKGYATLAGAGGAPSMYAHHKTNAAEALHHHGAMATVV